MIFGNCPTSNRVTQIPKAFALRLFYSLALTTDNAKLSFLQNWVGGGRLQSTEHVPEF